MCLSAAPKRKLLNRFQPNSQQTYQLGQMHSDWSWSSPAYFGQGGLRGVRPNNAKQWQKGREALLNFS